MRSSVDNKAFLIPVQNLAVLDQLFNQGNIMISVPLDYTGRGFIPECWLFRKAERRI